MDVYVLDQNLDAIGVIDAYRSLIWANRYFDNGDCELYLEANPVNINLLQIGRYLKRQDDSMVCRINRIEIDTNVDEGNYMIVTGKDVKSLLDQRIIWETATCNGNVEEFVRELVYTACIEPGDRQFLKENGFPLVGLGNSEGFSESSTEQVSYKNLGEKIREICKKYRWGYRFLLENGTLNFSLYKGAEKDVIFSDEFENLSSTSYIEDHTHMGNVALVGGAGEGSERRKGQVGTETGINRFELFIDAKDIQREITYETLTETFPTVEQGGTGYIDSQLYKVGQLDIQILDDWQYGWLIDNYPDGETVLVDDNLYYRLTDEAIAELPTDEPDSTTNVVLYDIVYNGYLISRGAEVVADYGETVMFDGSVIPDVTFHYGTDYKLGDVVTVQNEYGISTKARITEIIEVNDESGYSLEPHFETEV